LIASEQLQKIQAILFLCDQVISELYVFLHRVYSLTKVLCFEIFIQSSQFCHLLVSSRPTLTFVLQFVYKVTLQPDFKTFATDFATAKM